MSATSLNPVPLHQIKDCNGNLESVIMGLPIIKRTATLLGQKILNKYLKPQMEKGIYKFESSYINNLIRELLKEDITLMSQEYKCGSFNSYSITGRTSKRIFNPLRLHKCID